MVETIGEAFNADWQLFARCVDGRVDLGHAALKCEWRYDLDMMTLVATRGRDFPLASIARQAALSSMRQPAHQRDIRSPRRQEGRAAATADITLVEIERPAGSLQRATWQGCAER
ncbi:hypothetical protein [Agrobacterium sp. LMR679]|uniref:hypothetical protein n=1 Tax=Agrobacterium sp. LMR679 TaxID=3014335 RepID=UPI0022AEF804|nr:hypothetical protein [Agrobacterium sp. LMR679]MCZ4073554.1 hypothetical protein [Agrobacterium sp. LMR679]